MEDRMLRAKVAIVTEWAEPGGAGRSSAACVARGADGLAMALSDALERSGYPRLSELLAAVSARVVVGNGDVEAVAQAERAFADSAAALLAAWEAQDRVRAAREAAPERTRSKRGRRERRGALASTARRRGLTAK